MAKRCQRNLVRTGLSVQSFTSSKEPQPRAVLSQNHTHNGQGWKAPLEPGQAPAQEGPLEHVTLGCVQMGLNFSRGDSTTSVM